MRELTSSCQSYRPSHFELNLKPMSVGKPPCLAQLSTRLLLYAMVFSHQFDNSYFWCAGEHMFHCCLMHIYTCPRWSHGSSRIALILLHIVTIECSRCKSCENWLLLLELHPLKFTIKDLLWINSWELFSVDISKRLFYKKSANMRIWIKGLKTLFELFLFLHFLSLKSFSLKKNYRIFKKNVFWYRFIYSLFPCMKTLTVFYCWVLKFNLVKICWLTLHLISYSLHNTFVTW